MGTKRRATGAKRRTRVALAALAAAAVVAAATAALDVSGAEAQSQATASLLARECQNASGNWVSIGGDKVIHTQQTCRVRYRISVPKSHTAARNFFVGKEMGDAFLAPEILRTDVKDTDFKTPATTFVSKLTGNISRNDGAVPMASASDLLARFWSASADPDTMTVTGPYQSGKGIDFTWPAWQTGDPDPRVWDVAIVVNAEDGVLNLSEFGCFETTDGGLSDVFYRATMFFTWRFGNFNHPIVAKQAVFVFKDNDNGPYSVNHPSPASAADTSAPARRPAVEAPSVDVAACVLGEAATRSQWAARLVDCLGLRGTAAQIRLVPMRATLLRFSDIAQDPHKDDIVLLARYGLALGCEPGKFCGDAKPTETERMAVLMTAMSYGLIDMSMN